MRYSSIFREVRQRLAINAAPGGILSGLTIRDKGTFRLDGKSQLPLLQIADFGVNEAPRGTSGYIAMLLRTNNDFGLAQSYNYAPDQSIVSATPRGLLDWMECVMDALTLAANPIGGPADNMLFVHNPDGTLYLQNGATVPLLGEEFTLETKMAAIDDLCFAMEIRLMFKPLLTRNGSRRSSPVTVPIIE
jgi:hypothetical protein